MQSQLRRRPNAFNLLHQMKLMSRLKTLDKFTEARACAHVCLGVQAWNSAAEVAQAYGVGRTESAAAYNLYNQVERSVVAKLSDMVRWRGASLVSIPIT